MSGSGLRPSRLFFALLAAACLLLPVSPAAATDVTGPITISAPGTYVLAHDITSTDGTGIVITASDVVFDGQGHLIDGNHMDGPGIRVSNGGTQITNVTIRNVRLNNWSSWSQGLYFSRVTHSAVQGVTTTGNDIGIVLGPGCTENTISNSTISDCQRGVYIVANSLNTVSDNTLAGNSEGIYLFSSSQNTIRRNTVTGKTSPAALSAGLYFQSTSMNTIRENTITGNSWGILFASGPISGNTISENTVTGNDYGLDFGSGSPDQISGNTIANNNFNNPQNAYFNSPIGVNTWNTTQAAGTNIVGGSSLGGNFWGSPDGTGYSQTHPDGNNDGFCDDPYIIESGNIDHSPLHNLTPRLISVSPTTIPNRTASFDLTLEGQNLDNLQSVNMTRAGSANLTASGVTLINNQSASCHFDLISGTPGHWSVNLTTIDSQSASRADALEIIPNPEIASVEPSSAAGSGPATLTLTGLDFYRIQRVNLTRSGQTDIIASPITYPGIDNTSVACTFNLAGADPGLWSVTLTDSFGSTASKANAFTVTSLVPPSPAPSITAGFYAFGHVGQAPYPVRFLDRSTGSPTAWLWDFGDGETSTEQSPTHVYNRTGAYNVALTVSNDLATDTAVQYRCIIVNTVPAANFTANATAGRTPFTVQFTDQSSDANGYLWQFGDGQTSTEQNPVHTYTHPGTYTVTLVASGVNYGSVYTQKPGYITVTDPPTVGFSANTTAGLAPLAVQFTESTTGSVQYYYWQFGDGATSFEQNPVHVYDTAGKYTVSLYAIGSNGTQVKTIDDCITVTAPVTPTPTTPAPVNTTTVPTTPVPTNTTVIPTVTTVVPTTTTSSAFNEPHTLPGILQAEDYDVGGEGVAYHDTTPGNTHGAYRQEDVDLEVLDTDNSPNVGWVRTGEWLAYTVNVSTAGTYDAGFRVASSYTGSSVQVYVDDGTTPVATVTVPNTGDWPVFRTVSVPVTLPAGQHRLVLKFPTDYVNINWISFAQRG